MATNVFSERFLEVIDRLGVKDYYVWNNCGISKSQISHIRTGKGGASLNIIEELCKLFPEVNAHYILTGRGSMFISEQEIASNEIQAESGQLIKQLNYRINELEKELEEERKKNRAKKGTS